MGDPGALLGRTDGGRKVWGVIWLPVQDGVGGDPGGPSVSHHLNIVIDAVVGDTLMEVCGPQESHNSLGW